MRMNSPATGPKQRRVVVLADAPPSADALRSRLGAAFDIQFVPSIERAVDALTADPGAALLVAGGADRGPLCDWDGIERLGQGLCVLSAAGELRWANRIA